MQDTNFGPSQIFWMPPPPPLQNCQKCKKKYVLAHNVRYLILFLTFINNIWRYYDKQNFGSAYPQKDIYFAVLTSLDFQNFFCPKTLEPFTSIWKGPIITQINKWIYNYHNLNVFYFYYTHNYNVMMAVYHQIFVTVLPNHEEFSN